MQICVLEREAKRVIQARRHLLVMPMNSWDKFVIICAYTVSVDICTTRFFHLLCTSGETSGALSAIVCKPDQTGLCLRSPFTPTSQTLRRNTWFCLSFIFIFIFILGLTQAPFGEYVLCFLGFWKENPRIAKRFWCLTWHSSGVNTAS